MFSPNDVLRVAPRSGWLFCVRPYKPNIHTYYMPPKPPRQGVAMGRIQKIQISMKKRIAFLSLLCYNAQCARSNIGMSPSGKAPDFDSGIRRFKSGHPSQHDPLAQLAEQLPFKQWVRGSNPRRVTKNRQAPLGACRFLLVHFSLFTLH